MGTFKKRAMRAVGLFRNPYIVGLVVFLVWVLFFDANSYLSIRSAQQRISELRKRKAYYEERIIADRRRIEELRTDYENLEKYARETYYMRRDNEDLFIVE